jgi:hypothetical protein
MRAFTLIELLISLALGMSILVMAMMTFRSASASMADINRMSRETQMLRTGYWIAMRDADFWDSQANPAAPYRKGFMRTGRGTDSTLNQRRAFAPISFNASMTPGGALAGGVVNPNLFLPHHPGGWYRNGIAPGMGAHLRYKLPNDRIDPGGDANFPSGMTPASIEGDYGLASATEMASSDGRFPATAWQGTPVVAGSGYPRQGASTADDAWREINSLRPRAMLQYFQRLGPRGWVEYMPNGNMVNLADQDGYLPSYTSRPTLSGAANDARRWFNSWIGGNWGAANDWNAIQNQPQWRAKFPYLASDPIGLYGHSFWQGADAAPEIRPILASETSVYDYGAIAHDTADAISSSAAKLIGDAAPGMVNWNRADYRGDISRWPTSTSWSLRLPYNLADQERDHARLVSELGGTAADYKWLDTDSKPADAPVLRTGITRYTRFLGSNICVVRVTIEDPATGFRRELTVVPFSSSLRGARQHWALTHLRQGGSAGGNDSLGNAPIGDFYP